MRVRYSFSSRKTGRLQNIKKQRGKYPDIMKDVVRISDIILEVLDARFIEETRNHKVEGEILDKGKVLVYVINKSDLVDIEELKASLPSWMKPYVFVSATKNIGLKDLKGRIKMEAKRIMKSRKDSKKDDKKVKTKEKTVVKELESKLRIHVGVIGYPNAGKSSIINFITRKGIAKTAKQAGFTKGLQKIKMSDDILILDTPGVIPRERYSTEENTFAKDVKVGGRTYSDVKNPEDVVLYLMEEYSDIIEKFYQIKSNGDLDLFLEELGKKKGFLGKGGTVDVDRTARIILKDWQEGKIK